MKDILKDFFLSGLQEFDSGKKKVVSKTLRFVAHYYAASLIVSVFTTQEKYLNLNSLIFALSESTHSIKLFLNISSVHKHQVGEPHVKNQELLLPPGFWSGQRVSRTTKRYTPNSNGLGLLETAFHMYTDM